MLNDLGSTLPDRLAGLGVHRARDSVRRWTSNLDGCRNLATCGLPVPGADVPVRSAGGDGWHAVLRSCRNRLVCPWCSWSWRMVLARQWQAVLDSLLARGWQAFLVVLTVRHRRGETLGDVRRDLLDGWQRWRKRVRQAARRSGLGGLDVWVWALDVVLGGENGPHPHLNVLVAVPADVPLEAFRMAVGLWPAGKWPEHRRPSVRRGSSVDDIRPADVAAVTGYAARDVSGATFEALENRYREFRGDVGGRILSRLAVDAALGDDDAGRLLRHAAAELVGVRAVGTSAAWRDVLGGLDVLDPEDVQDILDDDGDVLGWVDGSGWRRHEMTLRECSTPSQLWARCVTLGVRFRRV